ncbi:MAG: hypothetical protein LBU65_15230 [Planctomycetaceae bacterium]|nr:hypothetical protein [Planctomycetaceae bacterium]
MEPSSKITSRLLAVAIGITAFTGTVCLFEPSVSAQQTAVTPAMLAQPVTSHADLFATADAKLTEARKALAAKDIVTAESILVGLQSQSISYPANADKPEYVLPLVHRYKLLVEMERKNGVDEAYRREYARLMLMQAEAFYRKNELSIASQLVEEAQKQGVLYNEADKQRGLEPGVMIQKIESARASQLASQRTAVVADVATQQQMSLAARRELEQSQQILLQARQQLQAGNLDDAERIARLAINQNVPESLYPQGSDTPNRIIKEVYARRQSIAAGVTVPVVPMGTAASNALYDTGTDQTLIRQTRSNPNDLQFVQQQQQQQLIPQPTLAPPANNMPQPQHQQSLVEQAARSQQVLYYQVTSEVLHQISEANRVVAEKQDPENALKILEQARARVENSPLDQQAKAQLHRNINTAVENTVRYTQRNAAMIELNQQNAEVRAERRAAQDEMLNVQKQLKAYVAETNKALEEGRYEDARIIAKKAKQIAPQDPTADLLAVTTDLHANIAISKQIQKEKAEAVNYALTDVDRASIIPRFDVSPLSMNADRWNVVKNRKGNDDLLSLRPESEQNIIKSLELPVSLNVAEPMSLSQFINLLKGQTGVPIVMDIASMRMVDVTPDVMISLHLSQDIKLRNALSLVLQQVGLSYVVEHEVLKITSSQASRGKLIPKIYYVGDLVQRIPNFDGTNSNSLDASYEKGMKIASSATGVGRYRNQLAMADNSVSSIAMDGSRVPDHVNAQMTMPYSSGSGSPYGIGGNGTYPAGTFSNGMNNGVMPGAFGGNMADFGQLIDLIMAVVDPTSWDENDEVNIMEYYNNLSLIIRQTEDAHAEIIELLNQLRKLHDLQITVEVRFITLNDNFFERMGVSFGMNFPNGSARARSNPDYVASGTDNNTTDDTTTTNRQWVSSRPANNAIVGLSAPNIFTANFDIPVSQGSYNLGIPQFGNFDPSAGISMGFAIMSDIEAQFFINAAEGDNRTNIMQAPKVTLFNGQYGTVSDTVERPFVVSQIPVVGDFAAAYQPVISIIHEGQRMNVQGTVSNNRQYVRLTLNPSITQITKVDTFKFAGEEDFTETTSSSVTGDDNAAASTDEKNSGSTRRAVSSGVTVQQPIVSELNVSTTVSVPDGGTILLGGIKRLSEGRNEYGTPILSKIPYISRLFSNTSIGRETQSILMIVTPRIIIQEEEEEALTGRVF